MKKILIVIGILALLPLAGFGIYAFEDVYYNANGNKAEKAALEYLEDKYGESFEIDEVKYAKALGDQEGSFSLKAHPVKNSGIILGLSANESYEITWDDYKESKWGNDARIEYQKMVDPIFSSSVKIFAYASVPEELWGKYEITDTYQTIMAENPSKNYERLNILNFKQTFEKEEEFEKIYQVIQLIKNRKIDRYSFEVNYYPKELFGKINNYTEVSQFEHEHTKQHYYTCQFSKESIQEKPVNTPEDIAGFCRAL